MIAGTSGVFALIVFAEFSEHSNRIWGSRIGISNINIWAV